MGEKTDVPKEPFKLNETQLENLSLKKQLADPSALPDRREVGYCFRVTG